MFKFLRKLFGGTETNTWGEKPAWSFRDDKPEPYPQPHRIDYELELSMWRYRVKATFCNNDPYAESEISYTRTEYEVRRSATGQWEIRLLGRNDSLFDTPEAWEPAPARFVNAWEQALAEREMSDDRT